MTDEKIEEIYTLADLALKSGGYKAILLRGNKLKYFSPPIQKRVYCFNARFPGIIR